MSDPEGKFRLLVKMATVDAHVAMSLDGTPVPFEAVPLQQQPRRRGVAAAAVWHSVTPLPSIALAAAADRKNPWDLCHELMRSGFGATGGPAVEFAEPDLQQQWLVGRPGTVVSELGLSTSEPDPQSDKYPRIPADNFWYKDKQHGQWEAALAAVGDPGDGQRVRVAHLDTGYDPNHKTKPLHLLTALQKNFVDADRLNDATDDSAGLFNNLGHGTGTLSILAGAGIDGNNGGKPFGCAPFVEVVPIRVANRVVLFSNSTIFQGLNYVLEQCQRPGGQVHVISMSMGGIASQSWADATNALYDAGVFVVTAAGNNFGNFPTHEIVYPARFNRVVAACGVMADDSPYANLAADLMAGNYGPTDKMRTAIAAYTPNTPWARFGAPTIVDFDGNGTSAATPQVAAAAALWIQKNRVAYEKYPQGWQRVEAVRAALFNKAHADTQFDEFFGSGKLAARDALDAPPPPATKLNKQPLDGAAFPFLTLLLGLGVAPVSPGERAMLEIEALQIMQTNKFETAVPSGDKPDPRLVAKFIEEFRAKPGLSNALRDAIGVAPLPPARPQPSAGSSEEKDAAFHLEMALAPELSQPERRRLRVFAYDPALSVDLNTFGVNDATISIPWEPDLKPGPVGEYLEVVDVDPASGSCYAPIDLNHPALLAQDGLRPCDQNPQFHQQMCYAVAMSTIEHFDQALGRKPLWAPRHVKAENTVREQYVPRLRIYPHALRTANSFYSPERKALLLGYFRGRERDDGVGLDLPGGRVFCAAAHDIIAHETTHALLDGLHRRYQEPTNPDVLAFHEAFADIVALFQHFTIPEALRQQIVQTRGKIWENNRLAELAVQFGQATSEGFDALRDAVKDKPSRQDYTRSNEPHERGSVLVAAVFAAFLSVFKRVAERTLKLATGGTGVLPEGELPAEVADQLARDACSVAGNILDICIRALDYCPPIDITFGDYLRALITADYDLVPDDEFGYRVAFISAFRDRGIFPNNVPNLSVDALLWDQPTLLLRADISEILAQLVLDWDRNSDRHKAYDTSKHNAAIFKNWLVSSRGQDVFHALKLLDPKENTTIADVAGEIRPVEVHSVRPARRVGPEKTSSEVIIEITQSFWPDGKYELALRGGSTVIVNLEKNRIRYMVGKRLDGPDGVEKQKKQPHLGLSAAPDDTAVSLRANYYGDGASRSEPFAFLHGRH